MHRRVALYRAPLAGSRARGLVPRGGAELAGALAAVAVGLAVVNGWWLMAVGLVIGCLVTVWAAVRLRKATLLFLGALPFFVYVASFKSISLFIGLPIGIFLSLALVASVANGRSVTRPKLPVLTWGLLVGYAAISAAASHRPVAAETRVVYLIVFGLFAWALAQALARGLLSHVAVVRAVVVSAGLGAIAVTVQFAAQFVFGPDKVLTWMEGAESQFAGERAAIVQNVIKQSNWQISDPLVFGRDVVRGIFPFMSPPSSGQFLMLGFLAALWLAFDRSSKRTRVAFNASRLAVALIGIGLVATYSRQSWLGALVGVAAMPFMTRRRDLAVAGALLLVVLAFVPIPGHGSLAGKLVGGEKVSAYYGSYEERVQIWEAVPKDMAKSPIVGVGPGQYSTLHRLLEPGRVYYAHNVLFDVVVELGLIGTALMVSLFVGIFRTAATRSRGLALPMLMAWLTANLFDDTLYFPRNGYLLATVIALGSVAMRSEAHAPGGRRDARVQLGAG
jgi:O-antigen ligase